MAFITILITTQQNQLKQTTMKKSFRNSIAIFSSLAFMSFIFFSFTPAHQSPWNIPANYKSMKNTVKSDPKSIEAGKAAFTKMCKSCHGVKGTGSAKIPSFATPAFKKQTAGEIYYKSIVGMKTAGMPNFEKKILEENERWSLVNYLLTF